VHGTVSEPARWQAAWIRLVARHAGALRAAEIALDHCDTVDDARKRIAARSDTQWVLAELPQVRAGLVEVTEGEGETLFWFTLHPAVADGLSVEIVQDELKALLLECAVPPPSNGDHRDWWRNKLQVLAAESGGEALCEFAFDHRRASPGERVAAPIVERLDAVAVAALIRAAMSQRAGLQSLLLTLLGVEARRRTGRGTIVAGSGSAPENVLPIVLTGSRDKPLEAQIRATEATLTEAAEHGGPFASLLYREFRQSRASRFDIALTSAGDAGAGIDLAFSYAPLKDGGLELSLAWNPGVYRRSTAEAWLRSFAGWARWLAEDIGRANSPLPALLPGEARCLARWEQGPVVPRPLKRFHELFEVVADREPDLPAVVSERGVQSYAELESQANRIAGMLLDHRVGREEPVAVLTECSADLPATVLGIWKAGAAYVPLALEQPPERLAYMARDAGVRTLIVLDGHVAPEPLVQAVRTVLRPEDWRNSAPRVRPVISGSPGDLAYIIYTSGTSGMPKGTLIQHDSLVNVAYMTGELCGLTCADRVSLFATPGFDASLWELGMALVNGMALVPVSRALRDDPWALRRWYKANGVTVAFHTPSYLRVSQTTPFEGMRVLIVGGEPPNHSDARHYANHLELWNGYGPTETCIFVCAEQLSANPDEDRPLTLGTTLPNTRITIRRDNGDPVPPGVLGEVWIGGTGLARGYLNNPELTRERFVEDPGGRLYRSGDLGRWTEDGRLELAGRLDDQIKLHGQRVELGEIEHALRSHPAVEEAVTLVAAAAEQTKVLRAFVRLRTGNPAPSDYEWRGYLAGRLPAHMVPASVTSVDAMPLTFAGKVDREALLAPPRVRSGDAPKTAPRGELEVRVAAAWADLLQVPGLCREDNFFALGGNSLLAVTMAHRLSKELNHRVPARELFAAPTLAGFVERIELLGNVPAPPPATSDVATEGQCEFWVAETAGLDTRTFNMPLLRMVEGAMPSLDRWNQAWALLVARHDALRTRFHEDAEGRLRREVVTDQAAPLESSTQPDLARARTFVRQRQGQPFTMSVPPLWRAGLVEVKDLRAHLFWLVLHHSVGDGQSLGIIAEELGALLRGEALGPLSGDFGESAYREDEYLAGAACDADARYWHDVLVRQPDHVFAEGPLDFSRSPTAPAGNHRFEVRLEAHVAECLRDLARRNEASLHAVMLTLLALEARRRLGREDVIVGAAACTRETAAEAHLVGYYVNMLPIACRLPRDASFARALHGTQQALAAALQHARYPFARMYHDFWSERPQHCNPARYPLFDLAVTEVPASGRSQTSLRLAPVPGAAYELTGPSPGEDMVLIHETLADGGLLLQWHVNAALFTRETASSWFEALSRWAEWLAVGERAQEVLPALLPHEARLLERWECGTKVSRPVRRFPDVFERVLAQPGQSDRPAIITQNGTVSYGALERDANALAYSLLLRGTTPGSVIGVLTGRSANLPAAVLGIWKAGAAYLPLAADLPHERLAFMARDAGMAGLIALDGLAVPPGFAAPLRPEELDAEFRRTHAHHPPPPPGAGAAYVIYTSGSTGQPKGALIGHEAYVNSVLGSGEVLGLTRDDRSLTFASPSFDVSLSDIGLPLAFGAALCPVGPDVLESPNRFRAFLAEFKVTVADITPTYLRLFQGATLPSLRILVTGGEAPFPADVEIYAGRHAYYNAYGPTENTITSTLGRLSSGGPGLTAGRPLPNTSVHVCDAQGNPVPPGMTGELWLGGAGLALGYVGRPELAGAFPETARGRRYRSGDLGRWRANGEIEILGRIDDQVKLNGVRVELGEIEHVLGRHPDVAQAAVLLDGDAGAKHSLWAFVRPLPGGTAPAETEWREYLAARLPAFMTPSAVIAVDEIPLSHSGKVDKAALKRLLAGRTSQSEEDGPQAGLEAEIARLWSDLLGHNSIHREDNFFALGGHSLLAIAVAHRLEETLGRPVPARELFAEPTLRGFARRVGQLSEAAAPEQVSSDRATEGQREFWTAEQAGLDTRSFNIPLTLVACGKALAAAQWRAAWVALAARHDALRTGFRQDAEGELRRFVTAEPGGDLEVVTRPDMRTALAHIQERQAVPFAMEKPPLCRAGLVQLTGTEQPVFWLSLHHSVGDGVSLGILAEDLSTLLEGGTLAAPAGRFDQSAGQEEQYLAGPACQQDALYWRTVLSGLGDGWGDEWPLDFPRPLGRTGRNARGAHAFRVHLDAATAAGLRDFAQKNGACLHALMLTIMAQEVRRRTGRVEFLLGSAASTRDSVSEARTVGYYANVLPVPCRVPRRESVEQTLRTMQRNLAEGLQHARYPFARMYADFRRGEAVSPARYPLFDLAVTENSCAGSANFSAISHPADYELRLNAPAQDMILAHEGQADGSLVLNWYVSAALYEKETAQAWIGALAGWARFLADGERVAESPLPALLAEEETLLAGWEHGPALPYPAPSFPALFEHWAHSEPHHPAVVTEQGVHSYRELNARSNALAHALVDRSVAPREVVAVFTGRSVALPETVLGIWKAGGCYLPLVAELPADRLAFIARDAAVRVLVVLDGLEPPAALVETGCRIFRPEELGEAYLSSHRHPVEAGGDGVRGSDLAYIIYTSGSTGVPKGVMLRHQGLNNLAVGITAALETCADDRSSIMASPAFDAWIAELLMAWSVGGAVVPVLRGEMDDIVELRAKFARLGVTAATIPPSYLRLFEQAEFPGLRILVTAGEPPNRADALHYAPRLSYVNGYGPTENTVAASFGRVSPGAQRMAAGKPLANTSVHILGSEGEPVPPGSVGTIWLGGPQLASGYLNRPDLTAASFVETAAGRLYCTGDLGRWTRTGELEILGRSDEQVKLQGQRIELGEIEHRLGAHPAVRQAVALVESTADGAQTLWAFACLHAGAAEPGQAAWHDYLSVTLPAYMVPSAVIPVPAIPVNTAGKVDRAALLRATAPSEGDHRGAVPREGLEQSIALVWAEQLKCDTVAREDNFFDLGGDSLRAIATVNHLRRTLECAVNDLYEHPRQADFATACRPRPGHLRTLIQSAARHWREYRDDLANYELERDIALTPELRSYAARNQCYRQADLEKRRDYARVLLTGATGYLGSYVLRELLTASECQVSVLGRASDEPTARVRLGQSLRHYFGPETGAALLDNPRLTVLAGDLRHEDLGLQSKSHDRLASGLQAIIHCAANVKHFGNYQDFHADNVAATGRLLKLAAHNAANPADFHLVSTLSVCGRAPEHGFRLFTEYDGVPEELDDNYYIRSKQQAERLVVAARDYLANATIHRVGNVVFAAEGGPLQGNIKENAFFRQLAAFLRLGVVPDDAHVWLCHVDVVARGLVLLAGVSGLTNETHHLENSRRDTVAAFVTAAQSVRACGFDAFLMRLEAAVHEPEMEAALAETLETFGLYRGVSPQERARRLEIVSTRTQDLLTRLGLAWPPLPAAGQAEMLRQAPRF
jgi:amino acid adenylation domain-containing protein/thioester reductase-like protein